MANLNSNPRGGLTVDRDSLHASDGYKRQIAAMELMKESEMAEKMTLEPCPFCGAPAAKNRNPGDRWVYYCPNGHTGYLRHKEWQARTHLAQPAQAVEALQDAIFQIAERLGEVRDPDMDDMSWHTQLIARAQYSANAQAVDVGALNQLVAELTVYGSDSEKRIGDRIHRAIGNAQAEGN